ncbi:KAT8 regulatory NSL complex subunit 3 [Ananas comosus]|uniref:KAT8 regulatory NSL complex subunit 3 n=1 Tax=Ananas comosus TaxID=4615 RepID=A0A6P5FMR2_ANACO|nr:KAT8 regulatory NSL complex subunit 3 [Ananas comosus]
MAPDAPPSPQPPAKRRRKIHADDEPAAAAGVPPAAASPLVVFAHGAGAPSTSEWMVKWQKMMGEALDAVEVVTFDYPYISGGKRRAPPKAEKLVDHHLYVVKEAVAKFPGHPLVLMGKSMGSRVSCMVAAAEDINVAAVICLGYPLKGINGAVRDDTLLQLRVPTMFVQGSKDGLCPLDKLESTRKKMKCENELHVIDGGDHSFKIGKKFQESTGVNQDEAERAAVEAIAHFVLKSIGEN